MSNPIAACGDALASYATVALAAIVSLSWMQIGAAALLIVRLIHDVPPTYIMLREWNRKKRK